MTREEAIEVIKAYKDKLNNSASNQLDGDIEAFEQAIKALEQEPSGDLISRQAVLDLIADYDLSMGQVVKGIHALPSVNPQEPKTGHREYNDIYDHYLCGNCKTVVMDYDNYCPNCGARMVEPQESEDKE